MKKMAQPLVMVAAGFLILAIWRSPATAATDVGNVLGTLGTVLQEALTKITEFVGALGNN
jgi:hypothetical protein